ncbi:hypothetical protein ACFX10_031984 [Malus domestica]
MVELLDLNFHGSPFTWRGMRNGELVEERLDRALSNQSWQECWPNTMVIHGIVIGSDHCPLIIQRGALGSYWQKAFSVSIFLGQGGRVFKIGGTVLG